MLVLLQLKRLSKLLLADHLCVFKKKSLHTEVCFQRPLSRISSEAEVAIYEMMYFHQQRAVRVRYQTGRAQASQNRFRVKFGKQGWGDLGEKDIFYSILCLAFFC